MTKMCRRFKVEFALMIWLLALSEITIRITTVSCWSNGGYSDNALNPTYGTHDWMAEHALDWLPNEEKQHILDNFATYLYGTELPDNSMAQDGIGDTSKHHIYYYANGSLQDDASAIRARAEYNKAIDFFGRGNCFKDSWNNESLHC
jgi:hypothetical protein